MTTTANTKRLYKVVCNGGETHEMHLGQANRIAKALRKGLCGKAKGHAKLHAEVVEVA